MENHLYVCHFFITNIVVISNKKEHTIIIIYLQGYLYTLSLIASIREYMLLSPRVNMKPIIQDDGMPVPTTRYIYYGL